MPHQGRGAVEFFEEQRCRIFIQLQHAVVHEREVERKVLMTRETTPFSARKGHDVSASDKFLPDVLVGAPHHEKAMSERDDRKLAFGYRDVRPSHIRRVVNFGLDLPSGAATTAETTAAGGVVERYGGGAHRELGESCASGR